MNSNKDLLSNDDYNYYDITTVFKNATINIANKKKTIRFRKIKSECI